MTEIARFFDKIKKKHNIPNNNQLAKFLGMSQNMVHRISEGMSVPGDETCVKIARVTGYSPAYVIALAHKSAAKQQEVTEAWSDILKLVPKGLAAAFFLTAAILLTNPGKSAASQMVDGRDSIVKSVYIIRLNMSRFLNPAMTHAALIHTFITHNQT